MGVQVSQSRSLHLLGVLLAAPGALFAQRMLPGGSTRLLPSDATILESEELRKDLPCSVTYVKPVHMTNSNPQRWRKKELSPGVKRIWAEWDALAGDVSLSEDELIVALFQSVFDHADEMSLAELADFQNNAAALLNDFVNELSARGIPLAGKIIQPTARKPIDKVEPVHHA